MNIQKSWYEIVIDNWAQIVVLLGALGYIIKLLINWNLKKNEISFSKIQENKILEVKDFYKNYQTLRVCLKQFLNQTEFGTHSDEIFNEIRNNISDAYIELECQGMIVKLFIEKSLIETIDEILSTCDSIRMDIEKWHIYHKSHNPSENWDNLNNAREKKLNETLPSLIKKIESSLRRSYNVD